MTFEQFLDSPLQPAKQRGTVFLDALTAAGKPHLANALAFMKCDPFSKPFVPREALDFVRRCW